LFIRAKRGYGVPEREHVKALAAEGFLVVAPEISQIGTPMLFLIGDADFELRHMNGGRAFHALRERGMRGSGRRTGWQLLRPSTGERW
jgi:hypothetical protein